MPSRSYEFATFADARVHVDYHVEVDHHYYSVPYKLLKQIVQVRLTANTVEFFYNGQRITSHIRSYLKGKHTTLAEHMPPAHQKYSEWSPGRFLNWAIDIGPATRDVIKHLLAKEAHPEQSYRACFGILTSAKRYGNERLESACQRALTIGAPRRRSILSILKNGLDKQPLPQPVLSSRIGVHKNIRGASHYQHTLSFSQTKP